MIISKTPLRISFVGGGSDIIDNHNKEGSVISVIINKFVYVLLKKKFNDTYRLSYSKTENVKNGKSGYILLPRRLGFAP